MTWWNPWTWGAAEVEPEPPEMGEKLIDHVFSLRYRYHVISKPAGHFDNHPNGEGDPGQFLILRCREGALPPQVEHYEEEVDDPSRTPEGYLPAALMRGLKNDMHVRRYKPLWGLRRDPELPFPEIHDERGLGEIGEPVIKTTLLGKPKQAVIPVAFFLPKGEAPEDQHVRNLTNALTADPYIGSQELVKSVIVKEGQVTESQGRAVLNAELVVDLWLRDGQLAEDFRGKSREPRVKKVLKLKSDFVSLLKGVKTPERLKLNNVHEMEWSDFTDAFEEGSDEDFRFEVKLRDTYQNAIRTVGSAHTFATIQAAINASASGDVVEVYGNGGTPLVSGNYNENLQDNALNGIQLIGMLPNRPGTILPGVRVHQAAGFGIFVNGNHAWFIENIEFDGEGTANTGINTTNGRFNTFSRCVAHDYTNDGIYTAIGAGVRGYNCLAYNCGVRGFQAQTNSLFVHCTAVDCTVGFAGNVANQIQCQACLASDNGTDYANATAVYCAWNTSSDLTAPGAAPQTGFLNTDFVNYAGDDFRLREAVKAATLARFDGYPVAHGDFLTARRSRSDAGASAFFAGAHHPITVPTILAAVDPATDGDLTMTWANAAAYTDDEMLFIYDNTTGALLGVFQANAGAGGLTGLVNGVAVTLVARATAEGLVFSGDSNTPTATPTAPPAPVGGGVMHLRALDRTMVHFG